MEDDQTEDRRPLKSRSWTFFQDTAALYARIGISPNAISAASVGFALFAAVGFVMTSQWSGPIVRAAWLMAALGIQLRLIANLLDGMVAVEGGKGSPTGPLFNEIPDRISDPVLLVAAGYSVTGDPIAGWSAAIVALFVAYVRAIAASVGAGQLFVGPMAKPQRMALLTALCLVGVALPERWMMFGGIGLAQAVLWLIVAGGIVTAVRRCLLAGDFLIAEAACSVRQVDKSDD